MGDDLVSRLRSVLYNHQVVLKPAATSGYSRQQALDDSRDTLSYLSEMLMDEEDPDDQVYGLKGGESLQHFQGLFDELSEIVSPTSSEEESVVSTLDIYSSLVDCARAVASNNVPEFYTLAAAIRDVVSLQSTPLVTQKVAAFFIDALTARLTGTGPQAYRAISAGISSRQLLTEVTLPSFTVVMNFANDVILQACEGAKRVHIVDYGVHCGGQWPSLIKALSVRPEGPPQLKITGIDLVNAPEALAAGQKLTAYAKSNGVYLEYRPILSDTWETVWPATSSSERLIVNSNCRLRRMKDEWIAVNNPRRALFERIYKMRPKVFVMCESNASLSSPFFVPRFGEALKYYTAKMECLNEWLGRHGRFSELEVSEKVVQRAITSVVACDGLDQVERPDKYKTWDLRAKKAGFQPLPLGDEVYERMTWFWGGYSANENFRCGRDENWTLFGWKDTILCGVSAWHVK